MRVPLCLVCIAVCSTMALAQQQAPAPTPAPNPTTGQGQPTGQPAIPEKMGKEQPQGHTGPLTTGSGGTRPESPQGDTPPAMQANPDKK